MVLYGHENSYNTLEQCIMVNHTNVAKMDKIGLMNEK